MFDFGIVKNIEKIILLMSKIYNELSIISSKLRDVYKKNNELADEIISIRESLISLEKGIQCQHSEIDVFKQRYIYETLRVGNEKNIFCFPFIGITIKVYLPFCSFDHIQFTILSSACFFEKDELMLVKNNFLDLNKENVVLDIGSNIGNHSLFFAKVCNASVYAFEPQKNLCEIAKFNFELNSVSDKVEVLNLALGAHRKAGKYKDFSSQNTGGTTIEETEFCKEFEMEALDNFTFEKIDFIKIDVEGYEQEVLKGAAKTLSRINCPIWIEIFPENKEAVTKLLEYYDYCLYIELKNNNYIYKKK